MDQVYDCVKDLNRIFEWYDLTDIYIKDKF